MRKLIIAFSLLMVTGVLSGCATTSWINDITVSPDGNRIDVVGAKMQQFYGGWIVTKPLRWICIRNAAGILECNYMTKELPTMP
jgi:hypothetical protein